CVQCWRDVEVRRAHQPALLRRTRHCRRYICNGLHRIAVAYEVMVLRRSCGGFPQGEAASMLTYLSDGPLSCCAEMHVPAVRMLQIHCRTRDLRSDRLQRTDPA